LQLHATVKRSTRWTVSWKVCKYNVHSTTSLDAFAWLCGAAVQWVVGEVESDSNAQHEGGNSNQTGGRRLTTVVRMLVIAPLIATTGT
jgi:hypothetical protein